MVLMVIVKSIVEDSLKVRFANFIIFFFNYDLII